MLLSPIVCSAWLLVVGGQLQGSRIASRKRDVALRTSCNMSVFKFYLLFVV